MLVYIILAYIIRERTKKITPAHSPTDRAMMISKDRGHASRPAFPDQTVILAARSN